jgi:hypothetical protein
MIEGGGVTLLVAECRIGQSPGPWFEHDSVPVSRVTVGQFQWGDGRKGGRRLALFFVLLLHVVPAGRSQRGEGWPAKRWIFSPPQ